MGGGARLLRRGGFQGGRLRVWRKTVDPFDWRSGFDNPPAVLPAVEEVGVLLAGEGAGDGFAVAEGEETGADGGFFAGGGVGDDGEWGGEGVGEAVVAVDAGDLFDEVDLALEVETPGGELDVEGGVGR